MEVFEMEATRTYKKINKKEFKKKGERVVTNKRYDLENHIASYLGKQIWST